ncbi:GNAT family N-acetyltransferase [Bacillaceae bacterium SIJ1]|uniref:GNAT family N-acetyltransferase n=1 Tax=Litoribacterium kuwaitense TaxID=1398745 RepID=UPI0013EA48BB|nr:GNAT family N-acetyltransferase [Litoribacterium kuwaitense]NGP46029.1 GNAT family N-acetyltransferase [Litoribacterium kuwaitense]
MELRFQKYNPSYLNSCAKLVRNTWAFDKEFHKPKKPESIFKQYVLSCENYSEHLDLIVDEHDEVKGILFGSIEDAGLFRTLKYQVKGMRNRLISLFYLIRGDFGQRKKALQVGQANNEINRLGETTERPFDSEVNLFVVSPELRGMGYGKKLMDRYVGFCKANNLKSAFLWTDIGCTYTFYEKYGFKVYKYFSHERLTKSKYNQPNGMVYYLEIV